MLRFTSDDGLVTIEFDEEGLVWCGVARNWADTISAADLGRLVVDTIRAATTIEIESPVTTDPPPGRDLLAMALDELDLLLGHEELRRNGGAAKQPIAAPEVLGRRGEIAVHRGASGGVTHVDIDPAWARRTPAQGISERLTAPLAGTPQRRTVPHPTGELAARAAQVEHLLALHRMESYV